MDKQSIARSFGNSLTAEISGLIGEYAEIGLDALAEEGLFKDIPFISTAMSIYRIGNTIRERNHIAKLVSFLDEINNGIADDKERLKYQEKFRDNEKFRSEELEYVMLLIDRYISFDKPQMLARLYLAYLDDTLTWDEFKKYAEVIDHFLPGDLQELQKGNQYDVHYLNVSDSLLRLISMGFIMEIGKDVETPTTLGRIRIPPATEKNYIVTLFGCKFLTIIS